MSTALEKLEWKQRDRSEVNGVARRRISETRCGRYRVVASHILYGGAAKDKRLADVVYAQRATPMPVSGETGANQFAWANLSTHRTRAAARRACELHSRQEVPS